MSESPTMSSFPWLLFSIPSNDKFQDAIPEWLAETQKAAAELITLRRSAAEAALRSLQSFYWSRDVGAAAIAYGEWLKKSMELLTAEIRAFQEGTARYAEIAQRFMEVGTRPTAASKDAEPVGDMRGEGDQARAAAA